MTFHEKLVSTMTSYVLEAGRVAADAQANANASLKDDDSYVTEVDLSLSRLAFERLSEVLPEHAIVSEEHLQNLGRLSEPLQQDAGADPEVVAVLDPIDGTRNYFHGVPLYGVSLGVFRDRRPWLGAVAFPALGELFVCDGDRVTLTRNAWGSGPETEVIHPPGVATPLDRNQIVLFTNSYTRAYRWSYDVCTWLVTACCAANACWPVVGRGAATILTDHIWDFAGAWPMLARLGFEMRGSESGERMDTYDASWFAEGSRMLREPVVVSLPDHYEALRQGIITLD